MPSKHYNPEKSPTWRGKSHKQGGKRVREMRENLDARSLARWVGNRVRLKPNAAEGWNEEFGYYRGSSGNGCCLVEVDERYRDAGDDGVREVTFEQVEKIYVPGQRKPRD